MTSSKYTTLKIKKMKNMKKNKSKKGGMYSWLKSKINRNEFEITQDIINLASSDDRNIVLNTVKQNGLTLEYVSNTLKNDREIVLAAVQQNGLALRFVYHIFKNDEEIVTAAIKQNGSALVYASDNIKDNINLVTIAVKSKPKAIEFASLNLRNSVALLILAVSHDINVVNSFLQRKISNIIFMKNSKIHIISIQLASIIVNLDFSYYEKMSDDLKNNEELMLSIVNNNGLHLKYINNKDDYNIVLHAVRQNGLAIQYASNNLKLNIKIIMEAIQQNPKVYDYLEYDLQDNPEIGMIMVQNNVANFKNLSDDLKSNMDLIFYVYFKDPNLIKYAISTPTTKLFIKQLNKYYGVHKHNIQANNKLNLPFTQNQDEHDGIAFNVHNAFGNINIKKYEQLISENDDLLEYVKYKVVNFIDANFDKDDKLPYKYKFLLILINLSLFNIPDVASKIIKNTIRFVMDQPNNFIDSYLHTFIYDTYHSYEGDSDTMSCAHGAVERLILLVGHTAQLMCIDGCHNETYKELIKTLVTNKLNMGEILAEWFKTNQNSPDLLSLTIPERKQLLIDYMTTKYKDANLYKTNTHQQILDAVNAFGDEYFTDLVGGKKSKC